MDDELVRKAAIGFLRGYARQCAKDDNDYIREASRIVDGACDRESIDGREAAVTLPGGYFDPAVIRARESRRTDFRERVILALIEHQGLRIDAVATSDDIPGACESFGRLVVGTADGIVSAAYPRQQEESA